MLLDVNQIANILPHRYPFALLDGVESISEDLTKLVAKKNVTLNEPFFQGHFPGCPVMPGVLIIEALAQACAILATYNLSEEERHDGKIFFFAGIKNARFKKRVVPGDTLALHVELNSMRHGVWLFTAYAVVDDDIVCEATMTAARSEP
ncbi:MAG TPA: 3-hydroxyacyl-[acyl-carrier-protein] dehydratase FabZ [Sutterella sp.]|nr:3-hydroxyacyl-[acyl-carrier-protein] dehydratase FabZ [Sutterella sp.]